VHPVGCWRLTVTLPESFLRWNYFPRRKALLDLINGHSVVDENRFFLESTRHNPALCTAFRKEDGDIFVNAKIVGVGYVAREKCMDAVIKAFEEHVEYGDKLFGKNQVGDELERNSREYQRAGASLLLEHLYFEDPKIANERVDFGLMSTIELALSKPQSSKHTWQIVQHNLSACLLFYQPPSISFEIRGKIEIHEDDSCSEFVNLVHDSFHYTPAKETRRKRPVYLVNIDEVYDNGPAPTAFGKKIA
jgi:hypothetical protein